MRPLALLGLLAPALLDLLAHEMLFEIEIVGVAFRNVIISPKPPRPACLAVSTAVNSRRIDSFCCAGIEKPSRSWSFEDTRQYVTQVVASAGEDAARRVRRPYGTFG